MAHSLKPEDYTDDPAVLADQLFGLCTDLESDPYTVHDIGLYSGEAKLIIIALRDLAGRRKPVPSETAAGESFA